MADSIDEKSNWVDELGPKMLKIPHIEILIITEQCKLLVQFLYQSLLGYSLPLVLTDWGLPKITLSIPIYRHADRQVL